MINAKEFDIDLSSWEVDVLHVGRCQNRLIKIKNFFSNPDKVREIALNANFKNSIKGEVSSVPGYVSRIGGVDGKFFSPFRDILYDKMKTTNLVLHNPKSSVFTFQKYKPGELCRTSSLYPHVDWQHYACVLSLNTNEELEGTESGTAFCRNVSTNMEHICSDLNYRYDRVSNKDQTMVPLDPSTFDRCGWLTYHIEPHEYNTLLMYEGKVCHTPYFNTNWNCDRITFNGFLK